MPTKATVLRDADHKQPTQAGPRCSITAGGGGLSILFRTAVGPSPPYTISLYGSQRSQQWFPRVVGRGIGAHPHHEPTTTTDNVTPVTTNQPVASQPTSIEQPDQISSQVERRERKEGRGRGRVERGKGKERLGMRTTSLRSNRRDPRRNKSGIPGREKRRRPWWP